MNETESTLNIRLEVVVTDENINDIMACALEGGINYWADDAQVIEEYRGNNEYEHFLNNGKLAIHLIEGPIEKHGPEWYELDKKRFINGLRKYLQDPSRPITSCVTMTPITDLKLIPVKLTPSYVT